MSSPRSGCSVQSARHADEPAHLLHGSRAGGRAHCTPRRGSFPMPSGAGALKSVACMRATRAPAALSRILSPARYCSDHRGPSVRQ